MLLGDKPMTGREAVGVIIVNDTESSVAPLPASVSDTA